LSWARRSCSAPPAFDPQHKQPGCYVRIYAMSKPLPLAGLLRPGQEQGDVEKGRGTAPLLGLAVF